MIDFPNPARSQLTLLELDLRMKVLTIQRKRTEIGGSLDSRVFVIVSAHSPHP